MTFPNSDSASATTKRFVLSAITDRRPSVPPALQEDLWHAPPRPQARRRPSPARRTRGIDRSSRTPARATPRHQKKRIYAPPRPPKRGQVPDKSLPPSHSL